MKSSNNGKRLIISLIALCLGAGTLWLGRFEHKHAPWLDRLDRDVVISMQGESDVIHEHTYAPDTIRSRPLSEKTIEHSPLTPIVVDDDPRQIFENSPPSPLDYAVIMEKLRTRGHQNVILTTQLSTDTDARFSVQALSQRLDQFTQSAVSIPVTRGPNDQPTPAAIAATLIPLENASGNTHLIPLVNQVPLATMIEKSEGTMAGFYRIESSPAPDESSRKVPLLCRWQDKGFLPSIELVTLMIVHGVAPQEVTFRPGGHLRLGSDGPVYKIDAFAQAQLKGTYSPPQHKTTLSASSLFEPSAATPTTSPIVSFIYADGTKASPTNTLSPAKRGALFQLLQNYQLPEKGTVSRRLPLWAEALVLINLGFLLYLLLPTSRGTRFLVLGLAAGMIYLLLLALNMEIQHWLGYSAPVVMLAFGALVPFHNRMQTSSLQQPESTIRI